MKKNLAKITAVIVFLFTVISSVPCGALVVSNDYMYDESGKSYYAPSSYKAVKSLCGRDMETEPLFNPRDLFADGEKIYIADTGNNRIVVTDSNLKFIREIKKISYNGEETEFTDPSGVFVGKDGLIYICDTGNSRVVALDGENNVKRMMTKDDLVAVNEYIEFTPEKVAVDKTGTVYVVSPRIYQGIVRYDENDKFMGFFAPNTVEVTLKARLNTMWKDIFTKEQQDKLEKNLPLPYNNIYIGKNEYIYTTAVNVTVGDEIKCMNALGTNILRTPQTQRKDVAFGDIETSYENGQLIKSMFVDVYTDESGMIYALDAAKGRVFQYDGECNLISVFGGTGSSTGSFKNAVAVEKAGDSILVLDADKASVTVFEPTDYMNKVKDALEYYNEGLYEESVDKWKNILKLNSNYAIAYRSIGRAYLQQGDYPAAMEMLEKGNDKYFYSMALKEHRKEIVRKNLFWSLPLFVAVVWALGFVIRKIKMYLINGKKKKSAE